MTVKKNIFAPFYYSLLNISLFIIKNASYKIDMKSNEKQFAKMIITNYLKEKVKKVFSSFLIFFVKYLLIYDLNNFIFTIKLTINLATKYLKWPSRST